MSLELEHLEKNVEDYERKARRTVEPLTANMYATLAHTNATLILAMQVASVRDAIMATEDR